MDYSTDDSAMAGARSRRWDEPSSSNEGRSWISAPLESGSRSGSDNPALPKKRNGESRFCLRPLRASVRSLSPRSRNSNTWESNPNALLQRSTESQLSSPPRQQSLPASLSSPLDSACSTASTAASFASRALMPGSSPAVPPRLAPPLPSKRNLTLSPPALPVRLPLTPPHTPPGMSSVSPLAPPATGDYAFLNAPPPKRSPHRLTTLLPRRPTLSPRAATINLFQLDLSFLEEEPPASPTRSSSAFASPTVASSRRASTVSSTSRAGQDDYADMLMAAAEGELARL